MTELEKQIAELKENFQPENKERYEVIKKCNPYGIKMFEIIESLQAENRKLKEEFDILMDSHNHFINKPIYKRCDDIEAENRELRSKLEIAIEALKILTIPIGSAPTAIRALEKINGDKQ